MTRSSDESYSMKQKRREVINVAELGISAERFYEMKEKLIKSIEDALSSELEWPDIIIIDEKE
jgi:hypothetical protein